jgi:hypothetical protein
MDPDQPSLGKTRAHIIIFLQNFKKSEAKLLLFEEFLNSKYMPHL